MFISNVVLPQPDLPISNPLIPLGSMDDYIVYLGFNSKRIFYFHFFIYLFFIFPYIKMYYLKCRRVTETENITTATSKIVA